ncbi:hypothetical protein C0Z01_20880 [Photobacterium kishitanii]|uniref:Uncharacterized protein n=1 Tax=Photobacterium kishitanii TaxID=318456 RepID=A0A2T3QTU3_9GAMM|nr:hypothetical protein [Photobacterium kishitanii]KJG06205.1 hypothetical protein UB40_20140 [Photobacterium kishitanii]KJG55191.1 hypothetical protein UA38_20905 [Photobacterium kishitanii]KJG57321.1 hypothetical protein UA42_21405 [Photobacterium kishitanii]KJG63546.1 hypothetical protein UA40_21295 [Photobacterium kishitanii]KJG65824.1 hypothetical protein UA41_21525 [Photobacterium kishitanii]
MKAVFSGKDRNNESATYWFDVSINVTGEADGMVLGVVENNNKDICIVDSESHCIKGSWFAPYVTNLPDYVSTAERAL